MLNEKQVLRILLTILLILFMIFVREYTRFVMAYILIPLGILKLPDYLGIALGVIVVLILPAVLIIRLRYYLYPGLESTPSSLERFRKQGIELDNARANLLSAIEYLDDMKKEISENYRKQEELNAVVKKLESVSKESAEELRTKLEAIGLVTKWKEVNKILIGFFLGILASLIASAIWSVVLQSFFKSGQQP